MAIQLQIWAVNGKIAILHNAIGSMTDSDSIRAHSLEYQLNSVTVGVVKSFHGSLKKVK